MIYVYNIQYIAVQLHSFPMTQKKSHDILQLPKKRMHFSMASHCFFPTFKTSSAKVAPHSGQLRNLPSQSSLHLPGLDFRWDQSGIRKIAGDNFTKEMGKFNRSNLLNHGFWGEKQASGQYKATYLRDWGTQQLPGFQEGFPVISSSFNSLEQLRTISFPVKVKRFGSGLASGGITEKYCVFSRDLFLHLPSFCRFKELYHWNWYVYRYIIIFGKIFGLYH